MTKYDLNKVRMACLGLMGHKIVDLGDSRKFNDYGRPSIYFKAISSMGEPRIVRYQDCAMSEAPDPTRSLDDALPLVEKYKICLYSPGCSYAGGEYGWRDDVWGAEMCDAAYYALDENFRYDVLCSGRRFEADAAPLAICLCALAASGRNPKDFEVSDGQ